MGARGPAPTVTVEDTLHVFTDSYQPGTPLTSIEVAQELDCTRRTAYRKLKKLAERGEIRSKKTGARSRIWWQPPTVGELDRRDADERANLERQPERRKSEFKTELNEVLSRMTDVVFTALDTDWRITYLNEGARRAIVAPLDEDLSKEALIGRHLWSINPDAPADRIRETQLYRSCHEAMERQEMISYERYHEERDFWVYTRVYPSETGVSIFSRDITELKETQRRLEKSNERLEQFAYVASHDLREPLRMVSSYLRLVERHYADVLDEDGTEFLGFAIDGADRMREMIDGLLEYSRVETQCDPFEPVDLNSVFEDVKNDLRVRIEESNATITAGSLPRVEGDRSQLRQVFQNLLSNAIEYSGEAPPRVHVTAERAGPEWVLSVRDEGIGIDPRDHERIFRVFDRLHSYEEHAGTGIGLALCKRIIERHGSDLRVDSEPDAGATFSFRLPAADRNET